MCIFCAAIPATLAIGVNVHTRQRRNAAEAGEKGETTTQAKTPVGAATALAVGGLVMASVIYHSQTGG